MLGRNVVVVCAVAVGLGCARVQADNWIVEWGGASCYDIIPLTGEIVIKGAGTYKFAAHDTDDPDGLGIINKISVVYDPNVPGCAAGPVYVYVTKENDTQNNGAREVWEIDLSGATEGNIDTVRARDTIATYGNVVATNVLTTLSTYYFLHDIDLDRLDGTVWSNGMKNLTVWGPAMGEIWVFANYTDKIEIYGSMAYLNLDGYSLSGTVIVHGDAGQMLFAGVTAAASITVTGNVLDFRALGVTGFQGDAHFGSLYWFRVGQHPTGGEFGAFGALVVDGNLTGYLHVYGGALAGAVTIGGSVTPDAAIATPYGALSGTVQVGYLDGPIYVGAGSGADLTGSVTVDHDMTGLVDVNGNLTGEVAIGGTLLPGGLINVGGEMPYPSHVEVGGHLRGTLQSQALAGSIHIGGDMSGLIDVLYSIGDSDPNHPFAGHIRVNGGFKPYPGGPAPKIEALDMGSPRSYITFDYDCTGDPWAAGAQVVLLADPFPYTHNTPSARIWHCVHCFADMNNDGSINSGDGTPLGTGPFYLALNDPDQYALNFPGLGEANPDWNPSNPEAVPRFLNGPVLFHGNCNCDPYFNWDDETAFLDLVSSHACVNGCSGELARIAPEELATEIVANVDPEVLPDASALMEPTIALYASQPEAQAYWQTVQQSVGP